MNALIPAIAWLALTSAMAAPKPSKAPPPAEVPEEVAPEGATEEGVPNVPSEEGVPEAPLPDDTGTPAPGPAPAPAAAPVPEPVPVVVEPVPAPPPPKPQPPPPVPKVQAPEPPPEPVEPAPVPVAPPAPAPVAAPALPAVSEPPTITSLFPARPEGGFGDALGLALLAAVGFGLGRGARALRHRLRPDGVLPFLVRWTEIACRTWVVLTLAGAALALVPDRLGPALPWVAVALALAIGWSARDALPDLIAWAFLAGEGKLRAGSWVRGEGFEGIVDALRLRATWLRDPQGQRVAIPNRLLLGGPLHVEPGMHPLVEVSVRLPEMAPHRSRAVLKEATHLSPWIAPGAIPEIHADPSDQHRFRVRVRLLGLEFRDAFEGTFPERVREVLDEQGHR